MLGRDEYIMIKRKELIDLLLYIKKIADDVHYYNDANFNCEYISGLIKEKLENKEQKKDNSF